MVKFEKQDKWQFAFWVVLFNLNLILAMGLFYPRENNHFDFFDMAALGMAAWIFFAFIKPMYTVARIAYKNAS